MTKKDYETLAGAIRTVRNYGWIPNSPDALAVLSIAAKRICTACENDNDRFDRRRFLRACGI